MALFALYLLRYDGRLKSLPAAAASAVLLCAAFYLRAKAIDYVTLDYVNFLSHWVDFFREHGGVLALRYSIGNYNIPYLYFLAGFSYLNYPDLYLIKYLSVFFEVLAAFYAMRLVGLSRKSDALCLACFFTVLFLPTVVLNGSLWGQCDVIYAALALMAIYYALKGRPVYSMVLFALSFAFKLQAVFILPVAVVLWIRRDYRWYHFPVFPLTYIISVLPAVLLGRPFWETITLYFGQTGSIGDGLNYNSSSIFSFWDGYFLPKIADTSRASRLGVLGAFAAMVLVLAVFFLLRKRAVGVHPVFLAAALLSVVIPYLLPHMHDRYFFMADLMTLVLAFSLPQLAVVPLLVQFASLLGYHAYLKMRYLLMMRYGGFALAMVIVVLAAAYACSFVAEHASPAPNNKTNRE